MHRALAFLCFALSLASAAPARSQPAPAQTALPPLPASALPAPALPALPPLPAAALPAPAPQLDRAEARRRTLRMAGLSYLAGVSAAALTVPAMMLIGSQIGRSSPDLATAAVPSLLLMAIVPPMAVGGASFLVGRQQDQTVRFHPAIWGAVGVNILAMVVGSVSGVWAGDPTALGLFTLAEALVMPAAMTGLLVLTRKDPGRRRVTLQPQALGLGLAF